MDKTFGISCRICKKNTQCLILLTSQVRKGAAHTEARVWRNNQKKKEYTNKKVPHKSPRNPFWDMTNKVTNLFTRIGFTEFHRIEKGITIMKILSFRNPITGIIEPNPTSPLPFLNGTVNMPDFLQD